MERWLVAFLSVVRLAFAIDGGAWPAVQLRDTPETMPVIEVGLAPPANPYPELSGAIGALEKSREALEQEKMAKLEAAYNAALADAKGKIASAVGSVKLLEGSMGSQWRPGSFLALRGQAGRVQGVEGPSVKVRVSGGAPTDASVKAQLEAMEAKRNAAEAQMLDQAISEMGEVTDVVVAELKKSLQQHMGAFLARDVVLPAASSFLERVERGSSEAAPAESLGTPMNVRVGTSEVPYPTIGSLAQDMETRRDAAERLERAKILELMLKLIEAENEMIKEALEGAI
jgi:hypothetical protein